MSVLHLQTPATFLQQPCSSAAKCYYSKTHGLRTCRIQPLRKFVGQLQEKRLAHFVHCMESRFFYKTGQKENLNPPTNVSVSLQCRLEPLSVKLENLVHSIFRNENSTLEIHMSHFRVLHWQQWQPPASVPATDYSNDLLTAKSCKSFSKF